MPQQQIQPCRPPSVAAVPAPLPAPGRRWPALALGSARRCSSWRWASSFDGSSTSASSPAIAAHLDRAALAVACVVAALGIATSTRYYLITWLGERVAADMRGALFARVLTLSPGRVRDPAHRRRADPADGRCRAAADAGGQRDQRVAALRADGDGVVGDAGLHQPEAGRDRGGGGAAGGAAAGGVRPAGAAAGPGGAGPGGGPGRLCGGDGERAAHRAGLHPRGGGPRALRHEAGRQRGGGAAAGAGAVHPDRGGDPAGLRGHNVQPVGRRAGGGVRPAVRRRAVRLCVLCRAGGDLAGVHERAVG